MAGSATAATWRTLRAALLTGWPEGDADHRPSRTAHPGAKLSLFEERDGGRYQAIATHTTKGNSRSSRPGTADARVEDRIRHTKDNGLGRFPALRHQPSLADGHPIAAASSPRLQLLGLSSELAKAEPKARRSRPLHMPAG